MAAEVAAALLGLALLGPVVLVAGAGGLAPGPELPEPGAAALPQPAASSAQAPAAAQPASTR